MNALLMAGIVSFALSLAAGPATIRALRRLRAGQQVREAGPKDHLKKTGTPTMGGVIMVAAATIATLLFATPGSEHAILLIAATIGFALVGLIDDFISVVMRRSLGLKARYKLMAQLFIAGVVTLYALNDPMIGTRLLVPFWGETIELHPLLFIVWSVGIVAGMPNAVNFTDGLDGLAAGSVAICSAVYAAVAWQLGFADAAVFSLALCGACLGFSWFNSHPAQVFMGDTGSLALGGALGALGVLTGTSLLLPIVGGIFIVEILSVIIQVTYFRITRGRRIFKMAPLHHHFELLGWAEPKIVTRFWVAGLFLGLIGLLSLV